MRKKAVQQVAHSSMMSNSRALPVHNFLRIFGVMGRHGSPFCRYLNVCICHCNLCIDVQCLRTTGLWSILRTQLVQLCWFLYTMQNESIIVKQLIPRVIALAITDQQRAGYTVQYKCDNEAVVAVISSRTSKNLPLMHLLRYLFFWLPLIAEMVLEAKRQLSTLFTSLHKQANDMCRNRLSLFLQKSPQTLQNSPRAFSTAYCSAQLDLSALEMSVQCYFNSILALLTQKAYCSGISSFLKFCTNFHSHLPSAHLYPTQQTLTAPNRPLGHIQQQLDTYRQLTPTSLALMGLLRMEK